jgi:RIO kinase 2
MKLDPTVMRTMSDQDFRVLEAVEKGMQRHSLVPSPLIASFASLRHGGTGKILSSLLRDKLLSHDKSCGYDGYRLTNAGYDILALHTLKSRKFIAGFGDRIGTGKESDVYLGVHPNGSQLVLKIHRLGRTSFRNVKKTRDYFMYNQKGKGGTQPAANQAHSWLFLSRKSALKEFAFMKALYNADYPTPEPIAHNRHIVVMGLIRGVPLYQVSSRNVSSEQAASIFHQASDLAVRLARHGLVHCDLNEFNLLVDLSGIQQKAMSGEHDPYVRHSGLSVAAETAPGRLSARGPWEPEHLQHHAPDQGSLNSDDKAPEPAELMDNGEPKPVVTLIDFPQMVSTQHPNAEELYERDTACLYKFFTNRLHFQIPEGDEGNLFLTWDSIQKEMKQQASTIAVGNADVDDTESVCLASRAQLRLDQELKASGYSQQDSNRDTELYYYYNPSEKPSIEDRAVEEDQDDDKDDGSDEVKPENWNDDEDDGSIESHDDGEEEEVGSIVTMSALPPGQLADMTRQQLQETARERVKLQLETEKKKGRQRGAFRKRNSNKTYLKGKRVFTDHGI